ncbi:MAG: ribosome silencing factor [Candidatus Korobacteraceae bacterium]
MAKSLMTTPTMAAASRVIDQVAEAATACEDKKAEDIRILELDKAAGGFTDYFIICTGSNPRQIQAIADAVQQRLKQEGVTPAHTEGYQQADWVLLDYVDFVLHVFSERSRSFYNLERLWKSARPFSLEEIRKEQQRKPTPGRKRATTKDSGERALAGSARKRAATAKSRSAGPAKSASKKKRAPKARLRPKPGRS